MARPRVGLGLKALALNRVGEGHGTAKGWACWMPEAWPAGIAED